MNEAQNICDHQIPAPTQPKTLDLFSAVERPDPYALCVTYFNDQLIHAKANAMSERFNPTITVGEAYKGGISVAAFAYQMAKKKSKKHPELKEFNTLIKQNFAPEIKENAQYEQMATENYRFQKKQGDLYKTGKLPTEANKMFKADLNPSYRYVLLMYNACRAVQKMPDIDLEKPYESPELLVSLWRTGKNKEGGMLYHVKKNVVHPHQKVLRPGSTTETVTPMTYAAEISQTKGFEALGAIFTNRLTKHQDSLDLYARAPHIFEAGHQRKHKPS